MNSFTTFQKLASTMLPVLMFFMPANSKSLRGTLASQEIRDQPVARIPFQISSGLIMISAQINDSKELKMYLDTGMSAPVVVLFHKELVEELGLKNTQNALLGGAGPGERKMGFLARGAKVRLDGLDMDNQTMIVFNESRETSEWQVDGIIGKTLFDNYVAHIDYEQSALTLYAPSGALVDRSLIPIPINLDIGFPIIKTKISMDGKDEIPVKLVVDLGHRNALFLNVDDKKNLRLPPTTIESLAGRGIQGDVAAKIGRLAELELGPFSLKNIPTSFLEPGANIGLRRDIVDGDIGQLILNRFNIIIDYQNKQMFLAPNRYFDHSYEYDMAGLVLEQNKDDVYYVRYVIENSPAAENGLIKGDKIVCLNGKDVREYKYREVFDLLRQEGRDVRMTIERQKERFEKTIRLRRLI